MERGANWLVIAFVVTATSLANDRDHCCHKANGNTSNTTTIIRADVDARNAAHPTRDTKMGTSRLKARSTAEFGRRKEPRWGVASVIKLSGVIWSKKPARRKKGDSGELQQILADADRTRQLSDEVQGDHHLVRETCGAQQNSGVELWVYRSQWRTRSKETVGWGSQRARPGGRTAPGVATKNDGGLRYSSGQWGNADGSRHGQVKTK